VFLFEQDGSYVVRLQIGGQAGGHHELAEFTRDDIDALVARGPSLRGKHQGGGQGPAEGAAQPSTAAGAPDAGS
jgi:hypothetical protein